MTAAVSTLLAGPVLPGPLQASPSGPARSGHFARMLEAHRQSQPAPPEPAAPPESPDPAADAPERTTQAQRAADEARARQLRAARQARPVEAGAERPRSEASSERPEPVDEAERPGDAADVAASEPAAAALDWLAALNLPPSPPALAAGAPARSGADAPTDPSDLASDAAGRAAGRRGAQRGGELAETTERQRQAPQAGADRARAADEPMAAELARQVAEQPAAAPGALEQVVAALTPQRPTPAEAPRVDLASAAHALSSTPAPAERPAEAPAPAVVHLPTPADAPEFKQALGAQLSVLARDGIQQAELHLNPADMGPISVQIALEGDQAKVDFGADSAATRQLIENGLPELAAALREAGFTLSGGGVHSQAQQSPRGRDGAAGPQARGETPGAEPAQAAAAERSPGRTVRAGGIDLYA